MSYKLLITQDVIRFLVTEGRSTVSLALECAFDGRDANRACGGTVPGLCEPVTVHRPCMFTYVAPC